MGVYIANAVPPEECQRCRFIELMNGQWKLQCWLNLKPIPSEGKRDDCPLIEIDLVRCRECKHYDGRPCGIVDWYNTDDDFCSMAERRTDEEMLL